MDKFILIPLSLYIFLIPTGIGAILNDLTPISYDGRLSGGGVLILLILIYLLVLLIRGKWRFTILDGMFLMLISLKMISFIMSSVRFPDMDIKIFNSQRNVLLSTVITYFSYFVLTYFIRLKNTSIKRLMGIYSLGAITTVMGALLIFYSFGSEVGYKNLYEIKNRIGHVMDLSEAEIYQSEYQYALGSNFPLLHKWCRGVESTLTLGPLLSFFGTFFLGYSFYKKDKSKYYWFLLSVSSYFASILMISRSAFVSMIVGSIFVLAGFKIKSARSIKTIGMGCVLIVLIVISVLLIIMNLAVYNERIAPDRLLQTRRLVTWANTSKLIIANPLGYGQAYIHLKNEIGNSEFPEDVSFRYNHAHNAYLQAGVEMGILGVFLVATIVIFGVYISFKNILLIRAFCLYSNRSILPMIVSLNLGVFGALPAAFISMMFESRFFLSNSIFTPNIILTLVLTMQINKYLKNSSSHN